MHKSQAKIRAENLREQIDELRYRYHVVDDPSVTDEVYDSLTRELRKIEGEHPDLATPDSPTQRVGGKPLDKFVKVRHESRMLSLNDAFSEEEMHEWEKRLRRLLPATSWEYMCELKFDGLATSLIYEDGLFARGATRGDGFVGEDITQNLKTIRAIPLRLNLELSQTADFSAAIKQKLSRALKSVRRLEVRGEVLMSKPAFADLNRHQEKIGGLKFANPRNAAAGSVRQLDPKITSSRALSWSAYALTTDLGQQTHEEEHLMCAMLGLPIDRHSRAVKSLAEVMAFRRRIEKLREKLPFEIDGIVVQVNEREPFLQAGIVGKAPRAAVAYKFAARKTTTVVEAIEVQVGRQGNLTPVAVLRPVSVGGVMVARASLHNEDEIRRLGVKIGDTVVIQRAGDVIPQVVETLPKLRTGAEKDFRMPKNCPVCGHKTERRVIASSSPPTRGGEGGGGRGAVTVCTNPRCPAKNQRGLEHFVNAFEIYTIGPKIIKRFKDEGLISDAADIFKLKKEDIQSLERFGEKSAENIVRSVAEHKNVPFAKFIYSLGILHVGEETAIDLAERFGNLDRLKNATLENIDSIPNIGTEVAKSIFDYFRSRTNREYIHRLLAAGVEIKSEKPKAKSGLLAGKKVVVTGTLKSMSRQQAKTAVRAAGGDWVSSVSKNTHYVVIGENPGSKFDKAKELGVKILNENGFLKMIE